MSKTCSPGLTVREVAGRYRVGVSRVLGWIRRGELRAINRRDTHCDRPSWVIPPDALTAFERGRQAATPTPKPVRRKKTCEIDYYPD